MEKTAKPAAKPASLLSSGGVVGGFFAFIGASCCVIPILLVHIGVASGLVARLGWFAKWQPVFMAFAVLLLAVSLFFAFRQSSRSRLFWITWSLGAFFTAVAIVLPFFEFELQRILLDWIR